MAFQLVVHQVWHDGRHLCWLSFSTILRMTREKHCQQAICQAQHVPNQTRCGIC